MGTLIATTEDMSALIVDDHATGFMCILYVFIGLLACLCNILNLIIFNSTKEFKKKYVYMMALDFGELINGISYILVGTGRGMGLLTGHIKQPTTTYDCFFNQYWVHSLILGTELPAYCIVLISVERMCAVLIPAKYNLIFDGQYKILFLASIPILGLISIGFAAWGAILNGSNVLDSQHCPIIASTARWFSTYHFLIITLVYVFSFVALGIVKYKTRAYSSLRDDHNRVSMMMTLSGVSFFLVGSSAFVMLTIDYGIFTYSDIVISITYSMPAFLSITNTIINLTFRDELKTQLLHILRIKRKTYSHISAIHHHHIHSNHSHFTT